MRLRHGAPAKSVVHAFDAWLVRQDCAARHVTQMLDALPTSERPSALDARRGSSAAVDPGAYDEARPAFYVYRLRRGGHEHVGVVGEVGAPAFLDGRVRGHEAVQPDRVEALVERYSTAAVRSELVALLHRPRPGVSAAVAATVRGDPLLRFTGPDAWEQTVWQVPAPAGTVLAEELSGAVHYIADGHHRVAASLRVWEREGRPAGTGVVCVMYPLDGLRLLAFHRRVTGPVVAGQLFALLSRTFEVREVGRPAEATGCFAVYVAGRWHDVSYLGERRPGAAGLDIAILDEQVLRPLLSTAAHLGSRVEITSAVSATSEQMRACDQDGGAMFALRPPTLAQFTDVADRGEVMPPKTTYFDPKPYAGIFLR